MVLDGLDGCRCRRWRRAVAAGSVGLAVQGNDLGVVDETVDRGGCDDIISEGFAPA